MAIKKVGTEYKEIKPIQTMAVNLEQNCCNCCGNTCTSQINDSVEKICDKCKEKTV